jgi:hypothetical protein
MQQLHYNKSLMSTEGYESVLWFYGVNKLDVTITTKEPSIQGRRQ